MKNWQSQRAMLGIEFERVIARLGMSQAGAGRWLGISERTARRIMLDEARLEPAQVLLLRAALRYKFKPEVPVWGVAAHWEAGDKMIHADSVKAWEAENQAFRDTIRQQREELALALGEATRLLESFVTEHCSPVPDWKPLPDLVGVLAQLSNAVTIARDYKAEIARLQKELELAANFYGPQIGDADPSHPADLAEIERLRDAIATCSELRKYDREEIERLRAEVERLHAALASKLEHMRNEANAENRRLRKEIEFLKSNELTGDQN